MDLPDAVATVAGELAALPGVVAVALGGSRAAGTARADSDWDLGAYYRGAIDPAAVRALGHEGHVSAVGEWGPVVNGGAWLTVGGVAVDVLYRDLDRIEAWADDAAAGRFDVLAQNGYLAGAPTYLPVGELAIGLPVAGSLPRPAFSDALAAAAPPRWSARAALALTFAAGHARLGDPVACAGQLANAVLCAGHARLADRREWVLNEKRLVERAGLRDAQALLARPGATAPELTVTVAAVADALRIDPLPVR